MNKITIQDLALVLKERNGLAKKESLKFVNAMFEIAQQALNRDKIVKIKGLGTFKIIDVEDRESINVNTGERVVIKGHSKITFTPDQLMKELVNKPFSQFETVVLNEGVDFAEEDDEEDDENEKDHIPLVDFTDSDTAAPQDISVKEPVAAEPEPVVPKPEPKPFIPVIGQAPEPIATKEAPKEEPVAPKKKPVVTEQKPFIPVIGVEPEPVEEKPIPKPAAPKPETVAPSPQPFIPVIGTTPESEAPKEEVVSPTPDPIALKSESVESKLEATNESESSMPESKAAESEIPVQDVDASLSQPTAESVSDTVKTETKGETASSGTDGDSGKHHHSHHHHRHHHEGQAYEAAVDDDDDDEIDDGRFIKTWMLVLLLGLIGGYILGNFVPFSNFTRYDKVVIESATPVKDEDSEDAQPKDVQTEITQTKEAQPAEAKPEGNQTGAAQPGSAQPAATQPVVEKPAQPATPAVTNPAAVKPVQPSQPQTKPAQPAKSNAASTSANIHAKYAAMDGRIRTGAYLIVGTDQVVKAQAGDNVSKISRRYLGPGMECYVEAYNGLKASTVLKAGQEIKIPKLQSKIKKKAQ